MTALPRSMKPDPDRNTRTTVSRAGRRKEQEVVNPFAFYGRVSTEDQQDPASSPSLAAPACAGPRRRSAR